MVSAETRSDVPRADIFISPGKYESLCIHSLPDIFPLFTAHLVWQKVRIFYSLFRHLAGISQQYYASAAHRDDAARRYSTLLYVARIHDFYHCCKLRSGRALGVQEGTCNHRDARSVGDKPSEYRGTSCPHRNHTKRDIYSKTCRRNSVYDQLHYTERAPGLRV